MRQSRVATRLSAICKRIRPCLGQRRGIDAERIRVHELSSQFASSFRRSAKPSRHAGRLLSLRRMMPETTQTIGASTPAVWTSLLRDNDSRSKDAGGIRDANEIVGKVRTLFWQYSRFPLLTLVRRFTEPA
jgi:hypothetical protein